MRPDPRRVADAIRAVAQEEIVPRFRALSAADVRTKSAPDDLVTVADVEAERALSRILPGLLPGSLVVGEEAVAADPSVLGRVHGDEALWIVDPVDGTINFANGRPAFGTIVALATGGRVVMGWILDPLGGRLAVAEAGQGAEIDGVRVRVAPRAPDARLRGFASVRFRPPAERDRIEGARGAVERTDSLWCAAHEYLALLSGEPDFALYGRTMPWDHAAGVLLWTEAGGHASRDDGTPYSVRVFEGGLLLAPDADAAGRIRGAMLPG